MTIQYFSDPVVYDNLLASTNIPVLTDALTIATGQQLKRGSLVDETGTLCKAGSEVYAVLCQDTDTSSGAAAAPVYLTGEFNVAALKVASDTTASALKASARKVSIFLKEQF